MAKNKSILRMSKFKTELIKELKKGEKSGFVKDFDRYRYLNNLNQKYSK